MEELSNWLKANQLEKYQEILIENDINDLELLSELTEDDIKELGFSLGDRKRFIIGIKDLASNSSQLSPEDIDLIASLPYVIAYPLQQTLLEKHPPQRINLFKDTFLNYLKYLGLLSASEFFNSDIKDKGMVLLFQQNLIETAFGKWNHYIRESLKFLKEHNHTFFCPELATYYELVETGNKSKKYKGEIEYEDGNGDTQIIVQSSITSIGMLINFRNRYLGHGLSLNTSKAEVLWHEYFPIFRNLLEQLSFAKDYPMLKREDGNTYLLHSAEITPVNSNNVSQSSIWIQNRKGESFDILPFFIVPGEVSLAKNDKEQMLTYESYTGKTIKFFSPEGTEKQTSGKLLEKLNLLLRDKQKEVPYTPKEFTKEEFLNRIAEENKLLLETLISEKKIIPGVYQHREEMEIKLREWIGARANIFFIAAEAGSGKTNLLAEIQKQYAEWESPCLLIRAGRMEKQSLKAQIAYLLNIDLQQGLENYSSIAGTQAAPTFILIDGLNEANHAEAIWQEILSLSTIFEPGSLKFVVTNRANTKADLERYLVSDKEQEFLYGENKENEKGLGAYAYWLTALDMIEMKGAWENYVAKDKARFKPQFTFDAIAEFDRGIYNQINNPLILRLFLEIYKGKPLPKTGNKHLHIWSDWFKTFSKSEQTFFTLLADAVWDKGENELLLDDALNNELLKPYFTSDVINAPYQRLKNLGWISSYTKDLNSYIGFTVEGSLLYLLGKILVNKDNGFSFYEIEEKLYNGTILQKSGIESLLYEMAIDGNLDIVSELIDRGKKLNFIVNPTISFLKFHGPDNTLYKIFETPSQYDWIILLGIVTELNNLQLFSLRNELCQKALIYLKLETSNEILFAIRSCKFLNDKINLNIKEELIKLNFQHFTFEQDDKELVFYEFGNFHLENNNYEKAYEYALETYKLALKRNCNSVFDSTIAQCLSLISIIQFKLKDYDKSIINAKKAISIYINLFGENYVNVQVLLGNIGCILGENDKLDQGLDYLIQSIDLRIKNFGNLDLGLANLYLEIGKVYKKSTKYLDAINHMKMSLNIKLKIIGKNNRDIAILYNEIGVAFQKSKDFLKAIDYYLLGFEILPAGSFLSYIANCYDELDKKENAFEYYIKSASIWLSDYGIDDEDVQESIANAKRLANEINKESELPEWMFNKSS